MKGCVSEKGQVTIPKAIRRKLGLRPGTIIEFAEKNGTLIGKKASPAEDPVQEVTGIIKLGKSVDSYLQDCRGGDEE